MANLLSFCWTEIDAWAGLRIPQILSPVALFSFLTFHVVHGWFFDVRDFICDHGRFPVPASCTTVSKPDLLFRRETRVNSGVRSRKSTYLNVLDVCCTSVVESASQKEDELRHKSRIFKLTSWPNSSFSMVMKTNYGFLWLCYSMVTWWLVCWSHKTWHMRQKLKIKLSHPNTPKRKTHTFGIKCAPCLVSKQSSGSLTIYFLYVNLPFSPNKQHPCMIPWAFWLGCCQSTRILDVSYHTYHISIIFNISLERVTRGLLFSF